MKVQVIENFNYSQNLKLRECNPENEQYNFNEVEQPEMSIYSKGSSAIAFNGLFQLRNKTSYFEKEIAEQSNVINSLFKKYFASAEKININLNIKPEDVANLKRIYIVASGSSKNSADMAKGYIEKVTKLPVIVNEASEFMHNKHELLNSKEDLAIFVSQSGNTADTLKSLENVKLNNVQTIALTNDESSKIATAAGSHVSIDSGKEKAVAATKTVTASIYNLMAIGLKLSEIKGAMSQMDIYKEYWDFGSLPSLINKVLVDRRNISDAAKILAKKDNIYLYANGSDVGAVNEGALKIMETTGKRVIPGASGEALHGTFASIKKNDPVVFVITNGNNPNIAVNNAVEITKKRNVKNSIVITDNFDLRTEIFRKSENTPIFIDIPYVENPYLSSILATIRLQQLTDEVTKIKGINPDNGGGFLTKAREKMTMN